MRALPPSQAGALAALSRGVRVTLHLQTGRMQRAFRALVAAGLAELQTDGVVTLVDTSRVDLIEWTAWGRAGRPPSPEVAMNKPTDTVQAVQVSISATGGAPVTQAWLVRQIVAEIAGYPGWLPEVDDEGHGVWLVELPDELFEEAVEEGGSIHTHSAGYVLEIPMP